MIYVTTEVKLLVKQTTKRDGDEQGHTGQTITKLITLSVNNQFIRNNQEDFITYLCTAGRRHR